MHARIGRNHDHRHAHAARERQSVRTIRQNAWRHVVVEAVGLVIGDDDRALRPERRVAGDRIDHARRHGLRDLPVRIARMVVVTGLRRLDRGDFRLGERGGIVRILNRRRQVLVVAEAAANVEHAAVRRQVVVPDIVEEVGFAAEVGAQRRIVGEIAEVLRTLMMGDVIVVRGDVVHVVGLEVVAVLIPAPADRVAVEALNVGNVLLDVGEIARGRRVGAGHRLDVRAHCRQRHGREREVRRDVVDPTRGGVGFLRRGRLAVGRRRVELRTPVRVRIVDERNALRGARAGVGDTVDRAADLGGRAVRAVLDPLRFAGLARDHRHGVWRGGRILRREDVVEDREAAGVAPEERDRVAVDVGHHCPRELLALRVARGGVVVVLLVFVVGHAVHLRRTALHVDFGREAGVAVIDAIDDGRVLLGAEAARRDRIGFVLVVLEGLGRRRHEAAVRIEPVYARECAVLVIERVVLVEDHEHVLDLLTQQSRQLRGRERRLARGVDEIARHRRIVRRGLRGH